MNAPAVAAPAGTAASVTDLTALSVLASAIAGTPLTLHVGDARGESYCDGLSITIADNLSQSQRRDVAIAHALLVAVNSFSEIKHLRGRRRAARNYFALELQRALVACKDWLPHHCLDAVAVLQSIPVTASAEESRKLALSGGVLPALPDYLGSIKPSRVRVQSGGNSNEKASAAGLQSQTSGLQLDTADDDEDLDETAGRFMKLFSTPLRGSRFITEQLMQILGMKRSPGGKSEEGVEGEGVAVESNGTGSGGEPRGVATGTIAQQRAIEHLRETTAFMYPEWDGARQTYRENWVHLNECDPRHIVGAAAHDDVARPLPLRETMVALHRVGVEFQSIKAQPTGDDLDLDALIEYAVELCVGHSPRANVYRSSQRTLRDLSALVLVDVSSSTRDLAPVGTTVFEQHRLCARALMRAFATLGDRVALMGFHSYGRHLVRMLPIKRFDELAGADAENRLQALQPGGLTRTGAAIRHGARTLERERFNTHRLLIVLSDGFAYDDEYESHYAQADTERALAEARAKGIACVCVSVGTSRDDDALQRIFGQAHYLRCDSAAEVSRHLRALCNRALRNVERRDSKRY